MDVEAPSAPDSTTAARYEALIRVSQAIGVYQEREVLFRSLANELRSVLDFNFLGVAIYDARAHTMEPCVLESTGEPVPPPRISTDDSLAFWVLQHQEPVLIPTVEEERRFPAAVDYMRSQGMRSACALPLTTSQHRVGMLIVGSRERHSYGDEDVRFLSLVAKQVALAIDNALNHEALQQALRIERERSRNLEASADLLRALSPVLDIREVFPRISEIAATVLPHDLLTLAFHDDHGEVVVRAASDEAALLGARFQLQHGAHAAEDSVAIIEDIVSGDPIVSLGADVETHVAEPADFWNRVRSAGYRSMLIVRARAHEQQLCLAFLAKLPHVFDERQIPVARRIADHVALCVSHDQLAQVSRLAAEARLRAQSLEVRVKSLSEELAARTGHGRVVGSSPQWQAALRAATQVAATDTTVLLVGESGTGKEVIARYIHRASSRQAGPFVALNCAALPEQLLESELFGYERGAFTSAQQAKPGQIELAAAGVLFLDEVSEMSPSAQAKFLRVLQEREFQRLGGTRTLKANVRVIAATNRDLKKAMERGDFREDLYYRLQVFDITLPPLRDRREDILPLSDGFLKDIGRLVGRPPGGLTRDAKDALLRYHWPGNVRELHNVLERAAILCEGGLITAEHLSLTAERAPSSAPRPATQTTDLNALERELIGRVMTECSGNKSMAAARLGLSRTQLYVRLRKHHLA